MRCARTYRRRRELGSVLIARLIRARAEIYFQTRAFLPECCSTPMHAPTCYMCTCMSVCIHCVPYILHTTGNRCVTTRNNTNNTTPKHINQTNANKHTKHETMKLITNTIYCLLNNTNGKSPCGQVHHHAREEHLHGLLGLPRSRLQRCSALNHAHVNVCVYIYIYIYICNLPP